MPARGQPQEHQRSAPIACSLAKGDLADRQERWHQLWQRAAVNAVTTSNGLRLLFRAEPGVKEELHQLADLERDCCAFADWSVQVRGEEVVLDVTAPTEEGITAVQAMFGKLRSEVLSASA
jgi:MerR family transcriptional regulator, copper efflux regulator